MRCDRRGRSRWEPSAISPAGLRSKALSPAALRPKRARQRASWHQQGTLCCDVSAGGDLTGWAQSTPCSRRPWPWPTHLHLLRRADGLCSETRDPPSPRPSDSPRRRRWPDDARTRSGWSGQHHRGAYRGREGGVGVAETRDADGDAGRTPRELASAVVVTPVLRSWVMQVRRPRSRHPRQRSSNSSRLSTQTLSDWRRRGYGGIAAWGQLDLGCHPSALAA